MPTPAPTHLRNAFFLLLFQGLSQSAASRALGISPSAGIYWVSTFKNMNLMAPGYHGGLKPITLDLTPPPGQQRHRALSLPERTVIMLRLADGHSPAAIAREIGRHRSTVTREIKRNTPAASRTPYTAASAHLRAAGNRLRPKPRKINAHPLLREKVLGYLRDQFSPRQIQQQLRLEHGADPQLTMSHEAIYQALYIQGRGSLREELHAEKATRQGRTRRAARTKLPYCGSGSRSWLKDCLISQRPAEAEDRAVPGHWEGDLVVGKGGQSAIVTLVERTSRFVMLGALPQGRVSSEVITVLTDLMSGLPGQMKRSLTWDQGMEMRLHEQFTLATDIPVFFCDPHSPWQRGSNENVNGLLRADYFPKGVTDFRKVSQEELDVVSAKLNRRPRATLQWANPAAKLNEILTGVVAPTL